VATPLFTLRFFGRSFVLKPNELNQTAMGSKRPEWSLTLTAAANWRYESDPSALRDAP
jgi:hypothetical protein